MLDEKEFHKIYLEFIAHIREFMLIHDISTTDSATLLMMVATRASKRCGVSLSGIYAGVQAIYNSEITTETKH